MVNVDRLVNLRGDVRQLLNLHKGEVDWSDQASLSQLEVLTGLQFQDFRVSDAEIGLNFVSCEFTRCRFERIKTNSHLWAAKDTWKDCVFEGCDLKGMIAPMNSFDGCNFEEFQLQTFKPYQTVFSNSVFRRGAISGLRAETISNRKMVNPEIGVTGGQLVFRNCRFESIAFVQCYFDQVIFEECSFVNVDAKMCSFDGIISNTVWWDEQKIDPFTGFLSKALELIRAKCGSESTAYKEFESYTIDYGSGRTTSRDFSASLYNERVPYSETQKIIKDLRKLVDAHPF